MRIPEHKIEEIRAASDIVEVIGQFVRLRKRGKNYIGLCPFHNEKTPSFTVSLDKQIFHCFGCHAGGNVFKFLMDFKKISYVEAIQELASDLGITIEYESQQSEEQLSEVEQLFDINLVAAKYFSDILLNEPNGEIARNYFGKRKLKQSTLRAFGLGYALPGPDVFVNHLKKKNVDIEKAVYLGLITKSESGKLYDKLSGRIIFPLFSPNGRVIGFAGRVLESSDKSAKYLNSPESKIYYKGRTLYGLSFAKEEIRKLEQAIIVEGYMDLISLYQAGIKNVVAVSGTAFTDEQAQLLSRFTKNVVLIFDADSAGVKASMRSIEILLKQGFNVNIAALPEGEDPDSYVNKFGADKLREIVKDSKIFLEFQSDIFYKQGLFDDPVKMVEAIRELVKPVALIEDELKRTLLIKSIAEKFNLREKLLEDELDGFLNKFKRERRQEQRIETAEVKSVQTTTIQQKKKISENLVVSEIEIIKLLYEGDRNLVEFIFNYLQPDDFEVEEHRQLAFLIFNAFNENEEIQLSKQIEKIESQSVQSYLLEITLEKHRISSRWEKMDSYSEKDILYKIAVDSIKRIKINKIETQIALCRQKLKEVKTPDEVAEILAEQRDLDLNKKQVESTFNISLKLKQSS